jgi:hypothetical protein
MIMFKNSYNDNNSKTSNLFEAQISTMKSLKYNHNVNREYLTEANTFANSTSLISGMVDQLF